MKNFRLKNTILILAAIIMFSACDDDETEPTSSDKLEVITKQVEATSYTDWVYYSFSEKAVVNVTDPKTETNWDIGLKRNNFRTNSGASGSGLGGAYDAGIIDFDSYIAAPETGYTVDVELQAFDLNTMEYYTTTANEVLDTWGEFTEDMPPTFNTSNNVFAVQTADGKFVKMIVQSYYGANGSGYITFKYVYQADGSTNLE